MISLWVVVLAVASLLAGSLPAWAADWGLSAIGGNYLFLPIALVLVFLFLRFRGALSLGGFKATLERGLRYLVGIPLAWVMLAGLHRLTGYPPASMLTPLWIVLVLLIVGGVASSLIPAPMRRFWASLFGITVDDTHGTARFEVARNATRHLAPAAPADGFVLGTMRDARGADRRFRQDGHVLTCAPTGAGKGIGAVIPNLLAYPGSAFVLDFKGENYAVTARARRDSG